MSDSVNFPCTKFYILLGNNEAMKHDITVDVGNLTQEGITHLYNDISKILVRKYLGDQARYTSELCKFGGAREPEHRHIYVNGPWPDVEFHIKDFATEEHWEKNKYFVEATYSRSKL